MVKHLKSCVVAAVAAMSLIGMAAKCAAEDVVRNTTKEVSYSSLSAAVGAAADGDTLKLLKDTSSGCMQLSTANRNLVIDGDGYTLTHVTGGVTAHLFYLTGDNSSLTLENIVVSMGTGTGNPIYMGTGDTGSQTVNLKAGTIITGYDAAKAIICNFKSATLNIYDGAVLDLPTPFNVDSRVSDKKPYGPGTVNLYGGKFKVNPQTVATQKPDAVKLEAGMVVRKVWKTVDAETPYHVVPDGDVAQITRSGITTAYRTFAAAISAAQNGDTVELLTDTSSGGITIDTANLNIVIDGHGYVLSHMSGNATTKDAWGHFLYFYGANSTLTLTNVVISKETGTKNPIYLGAKTGQTANLMAGTIITGYGNDFSVVCNFEKNVLNIYEGAVLDLPKPFDVDSRGGTDWGTVNLYGGKFKVDPQTVATKKPTAVKLVDAVVLKMKQDAETPYHVLSNTAELSTGSETLDLTEAANLKDFRGTVVVEDGGTLELAPDSELGGVLRLVDGKLTSAAADISDMTLVTASGGIDIAADKGIDDFFAIENAHGGIEGNSILILWEDLTIPATATWVGRGDVARSTDPANWECFNARGVKMDNTVPDSNTVITISGETTFNLPAGQDVAWKSLEFQNAKLSANCDWRGMRLPVSGTVDLAGHTLQITNFAGALTITDTTQEPAEPGAVVVDVPEGGKVSNDSYVLTGRLRLVKTGAGQFTASKTDQPYTGGTEIVAGTLRNGTPAWSYTLGGKPATGNPEYGSIPIVVRSGATLDVNGLYWCAYLKIMLDGGTLYNSTGHSKNDRSLNSALILSKDSFLTFAGSGTCNMYFATPDDFPLDLQGHKLSVTISGSSDNLQWRVPAMTCSGTIDVTGGGNFVIEGPFNGPNVDLRLNAKLRANAELTVGGYEALYNGNSEGTSKFTVKGVFKPTSDSFYGCTLADGATLDLSGRQTVPPATVSRTLVFEPDAKVSVKLGDLGVSSKQLIVAWDNDKKPTAKFRLTDRRDCGLVSCEDGLYVVKGMMILFR